MTPQRFRLVACVATLALLAGACSKEQPSTAAPQPTDSTPDPESPRQTGTVVLYYPGQGDRLQSQSRDLPDTARSPQEIAAFVLNALLSGSGDRRLRSPLPPDTEIANVDLGEHGVLYVDLASATHPRPPIEGSRTELLAVASLVDSLAANLPEVSSVVLLWNGRQRETFAGHVDTSRPLRPSRNLRARP